MSCYLTISPATTISFKKFDLHMAMQPTLHRHNLSKTLFNENNIIFLLFAVIVLRPTAEGCRLLVSGMQEPTAIDGLRKQYCRLQGYDYFATCLSERGHRSKAPIIFLLYLDISEQ